MKNWKLIHHTSTLEVFDQTENQTVCTLDHTNQGIENGNLIVSAPEMLEALERVLIQLMVELDPTDEHEKTLELVKSVIKKARGTK